MTDSKQTGFKRRQYDHPPIEEAICELRFADSIEWDVTIPGRLAALIGKEYDGKPRQQTETLATAQPGVGVTLTPGVVKVQMPSQDGKRLLTVGPNSFAIHDLQPYSGWKNFKPRIERAISAYNKCIGELLIERIGIRYINRIELPEQGTDLSEYLKGLPERIPELPQNVCNFFQRFEFKDPSDGVRIVVTYATANAAEGKLAVVLDIDVIAEFDDAKKVKLISKGELNDLMNRIEKLRDRERKVFEGMITDKAREMFDADTAKVGAAKPANA